MVERTIATNRKARHDYLIEESIEAGIVLSGSEIKSVRAGKVSLQQAYASVERGEAWLVGAHIAEYENAGYATHEPTRRRKLLLHGRQIAQIAFDIQRKGYTLVPLRLYLKDGWAKVEVGVARGKKLVDKRETLRERDMQRDVDRELARRGR
jgi:SsrA-binding protein